MIDTRSLILTVTVVVAATFLGAIGVLEGETIAGLLGAALPTGAWLSRRGE